jgi:Carboxypeptidase regulatory-like domain/TonB-dependent Receptor Plug Domain
MTARDLFVRFSTVVVLLTLSTVVFYGQTVTTGDLTGTITDSTSAVVPAATVTLKSTDTGETRVALTNSSGAYRFTFLKPGNYTISASSAGLVSDTNKVVVEVGQAITLDLVARVQAVGQTIEVSDSAGLVNTDNANLSATFSSKQMEDLPMPGGDITTIAFTVPGINLSTGAGYGNFSSEGLPGTSNLYTINGADYDDPYLNLNNSGASNLTLGANEISETTVVQNGYSVEYGRFAGAQINYVTKHGTNAFHGDLVENWNGDRLNANDFFNNLNGVPRPRDDSNQYAALISGPIVKNKLFFLADTEGIRYVLPVTSVVTIPSAALEQYALANVAPAAVSLYQNAFNLWNAAPGASRAVSVTNGTGPLQDGNGNLGCGQLAGTPATGGGTFGTNVSCARAYGANGSNQNTEWLLTTRVDYNISDKETINFRYKHDTGFQPTGTNLISPVLNLQSIQPEHEGQVNLTSILSPTMVNNFIGSALYYSAIFGPANTTASLAAFPTYFGINDGGANGGGFYPMGDFWGAFPQGRNVAQAQFSDDFSVLKHNHNIKVGINLRHEAVSDHGLLESTHGWYSFNSLADFAQGVTNPDTGSLYIQSFTPLDVAHIRFLNYGIYAQDEWSVAPNVKVMFGIRLDHSNNPTCVDKCYNNLTSQFTGSSFNTSATAAYNSVINTNLPNAYYSVTNIVPQPRVGIVWNPKGSGRTVIRAGMGMFADLSPGFLVSNVFVNPPYPYTSLIFDGTPVGPAAANAALAQYNTFNNGFKSGATVNTLENVDPAFSPPNYFSIPQQFKTPEVIKWSFEIEQPIGARNLFIATYAGNHGYNLLAINGFPNAYDANTAQFPTFGSLPLSPRDSMFTSVVQLTNAGVSSYDGVTFQFKRALARGFSGQVGYTWSHALDDVSNGGSGEFYNGGTSITTLVSPTASNNYSNADYDIRSSLVADFIWDTPWKFSNRGLNYVLGGWTISSKFFMRTGTPFSVTDTQLAGDLGGGSISGTMLATFTGSHLNASCGSSAVSTPCLNSSQFVPSGSETNFGNLARNSIYGPGYHDIDTSLYKKFHFGERLSLQIGASAYNLMNHPNFAAPGHNIAAPGFGLITGTVTPPTSAYGAFQGSAVSGRVMVLTGKFVF